MGEQIAMAISAPHYHLFKSLQPILPQGGTLLEIGEANWYGEREPDFEYAGLLPLDKPSVCNANAGSCRKPAMLYRPVDAYNTDVLCERHAADARSMMRGNLFAIAKACYKDLFDPSRNVAIDYNGSESALRRDLNGPIDLGEQFDLVINHGTAEHVFNIAQVFRTIHDHCIDGGLMIHESPCIGWLDHGFFNMNPTLFYDLAATNCYELVGMWILSIDGNWVMRVEDRDHLRGEKIPTDANLNLYVVYRKLGDRPFRIPIQGYYARTLSEAGMKAWEER